MAFRRALLELTGSLRGLSCSEMSIEMSQTLQRGGGLASLGPDGARLTSLSAPLMTWCQLPGLGNVLRDVQSRGYTSTRVSLEPVASTSGASAAMNTRSETLEEVRSRIFGTHIGNGLRSGRKVLRGKLLGPKIASYYPEDILKSDPFMPDLPAEKAKLKIDRLRRRGKAPPKKGAGKRAGKK